MAKIKTFGSHLVDFDLIPDGGVFIDAGTCQGNFTDEIRSHVREPFIIALEPNVENFDGLVGKGYDNMLLLQRALVATGDPKEMKFAAFPDLPEWGNVTGLYGNRKHVLYNVLTIDIRGVLAYVPGGIVHHLKMDIEGCEHGVVNDLTVDDAKRIQQISMEVHNGIQDMVKHLEGIGYDTKFEKGELYAISRLKKNN